MSVPLTVRIPVKDRDGRVIEEKEVATYAGLLSRAHEEGLQSIATKLIQNPSDANGQTAIVEATVVTSKGTFAGVGDANPANVNRKIAAHTIRMAETRAKARALRDAVNIGVVALEELGGDLEFEEPADTRPARRPAGGDVRPFPNRTAPAADRGQAPRPTVPHGDNRDRPRDRAPMTENQRRWLYRNLSDRGFEGKQATDMLCHCAEVRDVKDITKQDASALIDQWQNEVRDAG